MWKLNIARWIIYEFPMINLRSNKSAENYNKRSVWYLCAHHGVGFTRRTLPISYQAIVVPGEHDVQDGLTECLVDRRLGGVILCFGIRRIETVIENISPGPLAAVAGLTRRHLQIRQGNLIRFRADHHFGSRQI